MLDELGFIAREAGTADIRTVLRDFRPDLIVLGPLGGTLRVQSFLKTLQALSKADPSCCSAAAARRR